MSEVQINRDSQKNPQVTNTQVNEQTGLPQRDPAEINTQARFTAFISTIADATLRTHIESLPDEVKKQLIDEFDRVTGSTVANLRGLTPEIMNQIQSVIADQYHFSQDISGKELIVTRDQDPTSPQGNLDLSIQENNRNAILSANAEYVIPLGDKVPEGLRSLFLAASLAYSPDNEDRPLNINQLGVGLRGDSDLGNGQLNTQLGLFLEQIGLL